MVDACLHLRVLGAVALGLVDRVLGGVGHELRSCGIIKIDAHGEAANLQFMVNPPIDSMRIIALIQKNRHIKLAGQDKLKITASMPDLAARVMQVKQTIKQLLA